MRVSRHPETAYSHAFPLENSVNETFNCVLKHYIANVADLVIPLRPHAWIEDETVTAEFFHFTLEASFFLESRVSEKDRFIMLSLLDQTQCPYLFLLARIHAQHELLHVVTLRVVK